MGAKMSYLDKRQGVLAQNIANADSPGYRARDLSEVDFGAVLSKVTDSKKIRVVTTQAGHMPSPDSVENSRDLPSKITYEVAPAGNAVILEEQMVKANETTVDYNLLTNLLRKQVSMYKQAIDRQSA